MKITTLLLFFSMLISYNMQVAAQSCSEALNTAAGDFKNGRFDEVIYLLNHCYDNLEYIEKIEARKLLAQSWLVKDSIWQAEAEIKELLLLKFNYEPTYDDSPLFIEYLEKVRNDLSANLTTSVSKRAESLLETPATIKVITADNIRNRGYRHLEEVLYDVPGFDISSCKGILYSLIYQRGYRSSLTDRTMLIVDGVEENGLSSNHAYIAGQYPLSYIKKIEIIYGPASTMYGANAFAGVINVVTKNAEDIIPTGKKTGIHAQAGYGTWNTRFADVTTALKYNNISLTLTGRIYQSDEMDLSGYDDWDYKLGDNSHYNNILTVTRAKALNIAESFPEAENIYYNKQNTPDGLRLTPTQQAIAFAMTTDQKAMDTTLLGHKIGYTNHTNDWALYGKLKISDFTMGFQTWRREEGSIVFFNDKRSGSRNGSVWIPELSMLYMKYDKYISDKFSLSVFTRFKAHKLNDDSKSVKLSAYDNGGLQLADLIAQKEAQWQTTYYSRISKQLRTEIKALYTGSKFKTIGGIEVRNSHIQGPYLTGDTIYPSENAIPDDDPGGYHFNQLDIGMYAQSTYEPYENLKLTLGGRVDYNKTRINGGYNPVFNPRVAVVYAPKTYSKNNLIYLKALYATAFKDASLNTKFSTTSDRLLSNPKLAPERVQNIEVNAYWKHIFNNNLYFLADAAAYRSNYTGVVGTASVETTINGRRVTTKQYQPIGALHIYGLQSNASFVYHQFLLETNYTFTYPLNTKDEEGSEQNLRVADIASHQINTILNLRIKNQLNINLRINYVGKRKTAQDSTSLANPAKVHSVPAFTILSGAITYSHPQILKNFTAQLFANNIFDKEYFHPGIRDADGATYPVLIPQNRRFIGLKLLYDLQ